MLNRISFAAALCCVFGCAAHLQAQTPPPTITATIDTTKIGPPISKYLYGQFIEHLGPVINNGFWAEMLDDRKFYFSVTSPSATATAPATTRTAARGRRPLRRWNPIGPEDAITMDDSHPYVGDHSPRIKLDPTTPHGIQQSGIAVRAGKSYTGRVILSADTAPKVTVTLVWGQDPTARQTVTLADLHPDYAKFPITFTATADTDDAHFEIAATGAGTMHIGAVSLMPADNINGFRSEAIDVYKQLRSGVYRFPGGNFVSNHDWHDAIGDPDKRPPRMDYAWNAVQPNDVGTDEFMTLCTLLDVDPYITVNAGFGDAYSAAQQVEYANGAPTTPMGRARAANGHPAPYNIKFWGIGNEMYGTWQLGQMKLSDYEKKHNIFAKAMKAVDPSIQLIASGAMPDEMTVTLQGKRIDNKLITEIGSPADWTGGLLSACLDNIDLISEHGYCNNNQHFDLDRGAYATVADDPMVEYQRRMANRVRAKYEAYEEYAKQMPAFAKKRPPINLDEWSYSRNQPLQNSYRTVPAYAWTLHEMFRHSDVFQMAAFTFATACVSANRTDMVLNPTGLLFKMYRDHFGTLPLDVSGNSPQPAPKYAVGGDQPKTNAGSPTFPLDVSAAWTADKKTLTIAIINPTETEQHLTLTINGATLSAKSQLWRLAPKELNATVIVNEKPRVELENLPLTAIPITLALPPISVNIYEFPTAP